MVIKNVIYENDRVELTGMSQYEFEELEILVEKSKRTYYISVGSVENCYSDIYGIINLKSGDQVFKSLSISENSLIFGYYDIGGNIDNIKIQLYRSQGQTPGEEKTVFKNIVVSDVKQYKTVNNEYINEFVTKKSEEVAKEVVSSKIPDDMIYEPENLYKDGDVTLIGTSQWIYKDLLIEVSGETGKPITVSLKSVEGAEYSRYALVQYKDESGSMIEKNFFLDENNMSCTLENVLIRKVKIQLYRSQGNTPTTESTVFRGISVILGDTETYIEKKCIEKSVKEICIPLINEESKQNAQVLSSSLASMSNSDVIELDTPDIKKGKIISFSCNVTEMGTIRISHSDRFAYCSGVVEVTAESINYYVYTTELSLSKTVEHGLSIRDFLGVSLNCAGDKLGTSDACKITLVTGNGNFTTEFPFAGCRDMVKANAVSGQYTNAVLSFFCGDYNKEVWAFGDSYFDMWPVKAVSLGYYNFLVDGWSGRTSKSAYESLEKLLNLYPAPKKILWCMGMNDADSESSVNVDWETYYNKLEEICSAKNIELILTTIPNVPIRNNNFKNEIIRNSGYRYADVSKAVGADISPEWFDGLLSGDKVHPSELGIFVICSNIISCVPEIGKN